MKLWFIIRKRLADTPGLKQYTFKCERLLFFEHFQPMEAFDNLIC